MKKKFKSLFLITFLAVVGCLMLPVNLYAQEITDRIEQEADEEVIYKNQYRVEKNSKGKIKCYYYDKNGKKSTDAQTEKYFRIVWKDETTGRAYRDISTKGPLYYFDKKGIGTVQEGYFAIKEKRVVKPNTKNAVIYKCKKGILSKYTKYARISMKYKSELQKYRVKNGKLYTGWHNKTYYYKKGIRAVGWQTIDKKKYYFNSNGILQKNKIVGSKKNGYYYVDETGIRVTVTEIKQAVKFVVNNTRSDQSRSSKLKACYKALSKYPYKRIHEAAPQISKIQAYANYAFENKKANCYRYAAAFAYVAKVLGYESRVAVGKVNTFGPVANSPHGWAEIKIDGKWRMADISIDNSKTRDLYLVTRKQYKYSLKCTDVYVITVKNGKVTWK